jgi:anti-anti-sigma regulatory factor
VDEDAVDDLNELETMGRLELEGELDAHTAEALRLQIRRLARQHGLERLDVKIETRPDAPA